MFQFVRELMEREAAFKASYIRKNIEYSRRINIIYHISFIIAGILGFCAIATGYLFAEKSRGISTILIWISITLGFVVVLVLNLFRDNYNNLRRIASLMQKFIAKIDDRRYKDFLAVPFWVSVIMLWVPLLLSLLLMSVKSSSWVITESLTFESMKGNIQSIITFIGVLLGAQLTLFTFITGSLLGRYSGNLAKTVVCHRAYLSLIAFSVFEMILLGTSLLSGFPNGFIYLPHLLGVFTILCMILSIWITIESIVSERAIVYSGFEFSRIIRSKMRKPVIIDKNNPSLLWRALASLALDWRNPERFECLHPPKRWQDKISRYLNTLFNATNKAVKEGEQEIFRATLSANLQVMTAYTEKRTAYYGSEDEVFSFINNQMGAIIHSTSKISNEYLITDAIRFAGLFGRLSLDIGGTEKLREGDGIQQKMPKGHAMALFWIGLLKEGFSLSHSLMRCTGASEAQDQLLGIATRALRKGYDEVVKFDYLSALGEIHTLCLRNYDAYHKTLAANCYKHLLMLLLFSIIDVESKKKHFYIEEEILRKMKEMVKLQHTIRDMPTLNFSDIINVLVSKVSSERATLQDIVFLLSRTQWGEKWEMRACAKEVTEIIDLVKDITSDAIKTNQALTVGYMEALYEIGYILLCGQTAIPYEHRESCEKELFVAWREIMKLCLNDDRRHIFQWEHPMFGLIGSGMLIYHERSVEKEELKKELIDSVKFYFDFVKNQQKDPNKRIDDETWKYLQLLGAWIRFFLEGEQLGKEIIDFVTNSKPYVYSFSILGSSSSEGQYGYMGYPTIFDRDFFMPWLRNIQQRLSEDELKKFRNMQDRLMSKEVLVPCYQEIEKIRAPLREKFYEEMRKKRNNLSEG